jgi:hypothetical protein
MATMVRNRRSSFGTYCAQCDDELIAPEWSEYRNKRRIRHLWHCWKCDFSFETIVDTQSMVMTKDVILPTLLVA